MSYIVLTGISIMVACLIESVDIKKSKSGRRPRHFFQKWHVYFPWIEEYKLAILLDAICFLPINLLCGFFAASNHFIITLEIIYLFSILIIILFKNIKIQRELCY
jgi:hypothetical protein